MYLPLALKPANVEETGRLLTCLSFIVLQLIYQFQQWLVQSQKYANEPWVYERLHSLTRKTP